MSLLPTASTVFESLPRTLRRHRLMKAWMRVTGEDPLQLVRIRDDCFGYADMSDGFLRLIVIDGGFERDFFAMADALLADGGVFLDVGANYGLLSCGLACRHAGRVEFHLFEPNRTLVGAIERSIARYPRAKWTVNPVAVSDRDGAVGFAVDAEQSGASHISQDGGEQIRSVTIDSYLQQAGIEHVALWKMDIEGYELTAVRGARTSLEARRIAAVYFEYFEKLLVRVAPPSDLIAQFAALGYEVCFCRDYDIAGHGGATHTLRRGLPGHGIALVPVKGKAIPAMTDLIAVPQEHLAAIGQ